MTTTTPEPISAVLERLLDRWEVRDPREVVRAELAAATDHLERARRAYWAEPGEPCRIEAVIRAEAEVAALQRVASRVRGEVGA